MHTKDSFDAKRATHDLYEESRALPDSHPDRLAIDAKQDEIFSKVPHPTRSEAPRSSGRHTVTRTTTYYRVYTDEPAPRDRPRGLYRRVLEDGRVVVSEAYHPRTGWVLNDYWARVTYKGEQEKLLVELDEQQARETQDTFDALHRGRTD